MNRKVYRVLPARVREFCCGVRLACLPLASGEREEVHASREDVGGACGAGSAA
jgi:hypothetical protein